MTTTQTIPDNTQLQLHNDVVMCNRCKGDYAVQVALDLKNIKTKCPWCEKVQEYSPSPQTETSDRPSGGTTLSNKK
jgi:hypothetical protein